MASSKKRGCTYSRNARTDKCRSATAHYAWTMGSGKKKGVCSYGRYKKRCMSKKQSEARRKAAARRIQKSFRRKK
jgi:hypothetical protein